MGKGGAHEPGQAGEICCVQRQPCRPGSREEGRDVRYALRQESVSRAGALVKGAGPYEALIRLRQTVGDQLIHGLSEAGKGQQPARRDGAPILGIHCARCQESRKRTSPSRGRSMEELLEIDGVMAPNL